MALTQRYRARAWMELWKLSVLAMGKSLRLFLLLSEGRFGFLLDFSRRGGERLAPRGSHTMTGLKIGFGLFAGLGAMAAVCVSLVGLDGCGSTGSVWTD